MQRNVTIDGQIIELTPFDNNVIDMVTRINILNRSAMLL